MGESGNVIVDVNISNLYVDISTASQAISCYQFVLTQQTYKWLKRPTNIGEQVLRFLNSVKI